MFNEILNINSTTEVSLFPAVVFFRGDFMWGFFSFSFFLLCHAHLMSCSSCSSCFGSDHHWRADASTFRLGHLTAKKTKTQHSKLFLSTNAHFIFWLGWGPYWFGWNGWSKSNLNKGSRVLLQKKYSFTTLYLGLLFNPSINRHHTKYYLCLVHYDCLLQVVVLLSRNIYFIILGGKLFINYYIRH